MRTAERDILAPASSGSGPLAERARDAERGERGAPRVILVGQRGAEERHEAVAEELVDGALVAVDLGQGGLEEAVEEDVHGLRPQPFGQRGGADQVAEEHGDRLALAFQRRARGEDPLGEVARRVGIGGVRRRHGGPRGLDRAAAGRTEARALRELDAARGTGDRQAGAARDAEARPDGIVVTAATALHACWSGGSDGASRSQSSDAAGAGQASARIASCEPVRAGEAAASWGTRLTSPDDGVSSGTLGNAAIAGTEVSGRQPIRSQ